MTTTQRIHDYLTAYGEPDPKRREALIASAFAPDAMLADPPFSAKGHAELGQAFASVQSQFPGHHFERTSAVDEHHGFARYTWSLIDPEGTPALSGTDMVAFDAEARITHVVGFFGDPPAS